MGPDIMDMWRQYNPRWMCEDYGISLEKILDIMDMIGLRDNIS